MSHLSVFNIGTGHNRNEKDNLLVKLFDDCPSLPIDDSTIDDVTVNLAARGHRKVINDGLGSEEADTGAPGRAESSARHFREGLLGKGLESRALRMVRLIERTSGLTEVTMAGHSRGAMIALRTAIELWNKYKKDFRVNLWLLDPVEFSLDGGKPYREIPANVQHVRIVVMEDTHDICGYRGGFKLQTLLGSNDPTRNNFIRMPGSHGTASQVNGNPIGEVAFQIARRDFRRWNVPVGSALWSNFDLCNEYFRIHLVNPVTKHEVSRLKSLMGYTELSRLVNDADAPDGSKTVTTDSRAKKLDNLKITNRFRGHLFFINEHHFQLFRSIFPVLAKAVLMLSNDEKKTWDDVKKEQGLILELRELKSRCPQGFNLMMLQYAEA